MISGTYTGKLPVLRCCWEHRQAADILCRNWEKNTAIVSVRSSVPVISFLLILSEEQTGFVRLVISFRAG